MKIIRSPRIYLLGRLSIEQSELAQFLADHEFSDWSTDSPCDAESLVEIAARTCYQSFKGGRPHDEHLKHILEVGHGSVIEHAVWNFLVTGISRSCSHELVRHRAGVGVSQLSQRYVDESVAEYVEPDVIAEYPSLHTLWEDAIATAHRAYQALVKELTIVEINRRYPHDGIHTPECATAYLKNMRKYGFHEDATEIIKAARQAARSVLPNATETKIFVTMNARAARNFLELRASRHAEPEIRQVANQVFHILREEAPNLFGDYQVTSLPDGTFELATPHRKV